MTIVDLRSDTVTLPSKAMRQAMADAEVGDSQYGEDPTVNRLQDRIAEMLGKEAAVWFNSGTQSNQAALMTLTRPGDEAIISREAHAAWHEAGGAALIAGIQMVEVGNKGRFTATEMLTAWEAGADLCKLFPATALGPKYIKDIHGPLPQIEIIPTGGVTYENTPDFIKAGAAAVAAGSAMVPKDALAAGDFDAIRDMGAKFVKAVKDARA